MQIRNPQYNAFGTIDCEIEHPQFGWIPFTASPDDAETHGRQVYELALGLDPEPYVAPEVIEPTPDELLAAWRQSATLSRTEFCIALKRAKILPPQEAVIAAKGDWPPSFDAALAEFPDEDEAKIIWAAVSYIERLHPMILALQAFLNQQTPDALSDSMLDELFGWEVA